MNITGRWGAVSLTGERAGPYITVTGETLTTTITIDNDRQVSINIIDLPSPLGVAVDVDTAYEAVIDLEARDIYGVVVEIHATYIPEDVLIIDDQLVRDFLPNDYLLVKSV